VIDHALFPATVADQGQATSSVFHTCPLTGFDAEAAGKEWQHDHVSAVELIRPPMTTMASGFLISEPGALANSKGQQTEQGDAGGHQHRAQTAFGAPR